MVFSPAFDIQDERPHSPIQLAVRFQQVRVSYADVVVQVDVTIKVTLLFVANIIHIIFFVFQNQYHIRIAYFCESWNFMMGTLA